MISEKLLKLTKYTLKLNTEKNNIKNVKILNYNLNTNVMWKWIFKSPFGAVNRTPHTCATPFPLSQKNEMSV